MMMKTRHIQVLLLLVLVNITSGSDRLTGRVTKVPDGRDCPESNQDFGEEATQFVNEAAYGKIVEMIITDKDRYGRHIAKIILPVSNFTVLKVPPERNIG